MDWELQGSVALVTGAATGIGAGIAGRLAEAGAVVVRADVAWTGEEDSAETLTLDVRDRDAVHRAADRIVAEHSRLDVLVNNAGTMRAKPFAEYDGDDWNFIFDVNARGLFFCLQAATRVMSDQGGGAIVNIASIAGRNGRTLSPVYAASKASVINLTRSTALEFAARNVRVNAICPGLIDTAFNQRLGEQFGPEQGLTPREFVEKRAEMIPLGRVGTPDDIADVACFLASPAAGYVTGQTLNVDGGIVMD